ncbi:zinc-binding dehydrogenase [Nocardiopsis coralliicola]
MANAATMTAARIVRHGGPDALEVVRVPVPEPGEGEVLVRIGATALNNTDLWTGEGAYGLAGDPDALAGWRGPIAFPRIQGADFAGTVAAAGPGADPELVGKRVLVDPAIYSGHGDGADPVGLLGSERDGGYAEYAAVSAERVHLMEGSPLSDAELACFPTAYGTALGMMENGGVRPGDTVVVTGASGGVGLALVQLCADRGTRVIAVSSAGKLDAVRDAGADHVFDRAQGDLWEQVAAAAPEGVAVGLDVVAGTNVAAGIDVLREGGRWVVAGALGGHRIVLDVRRLYLHNRSLVGSSMHTPAVFRMLAGIARSGRVRPVVSEIVPLTGVHRAQAELATRAHVGKLVVAPEQ